MQEQNRMVLSIGGQTVSTYIEACVAIRRVIGLVHGQALITRVLGHHVIDFRLSPEQMGLLDTEMGLEMGRLMRVPVFVPPADFNFTIDPALGTIATTNAPIMEVRMPTRGRTVEEEIRYREINSTSHTILWPDWVMEEYNRLQPLREIGLSNAELHRIMPQDQVEVAIRANRMWWITTSPAPMAEVPIVPPQPPVRIRVRVHRTTDAYAQWEIWVKIDNGLQNLPSVKIIKSLLPPEDKRYLPSRVSRYTSVKAYLSTALEAGLTAQSLHDALKAWAIAKMSTSTTAESDSALDAGTDALLKAQPATLEVAGRVYKLVPCGSIDTRPLIAKVRRKALATVAVESEAIKSRAATDARVVVSQAEERATRIKNEAEEIKRRAGQTCPEWIINSHRSHFFDGAHWNVKLEVQCQIRDIRFTVTEWNYLILHWTPLPMPEFCPAFPVWLNLGAAGEFNNHSIFAAEDYDCAHISSFMCMDLQGMPRMATSNAHLLATEAAISRGMQVVNMNSLLSHSPNKYWPPFLAQIPPIVIKLMKGDARIRPINIRTESGRERRETPEEFRARCHNITWDSVETIAQENEGTFSTDAPPPTLIRPAVAVPAVPPEVEEIARAIAATREE